MTDLNLKAVRVKQVIAMFMAVCLTVLSVNVDVMAAAAKDVYKTFSFCEGQEWLGVATDFDGHALTTYLDGTEATAYNGAVEVSAAFAPGADQIFNIAEGNKIVTAVDGEIYDNVLVDVVENPYAVKLVSDVELTFTPVGYPEAAEKINITVAQEAGPAANTVSAGDDIQEVYQTTQYNGDPTDAASPFDGVSQEISVSNDFVSENYINSLKDYEAVKTVTFYDGINKGTLPNYATGNNVKLVVGSEVAYVSTAADYIDKNKSSRIAAIEQAYVQGKDFAGYDVYYKTYADTKKKKPVYTKTASAVEFNQIETLGAEGTIAVAVYKDAEAVNANLYAEVKMATKSKANVQMAVATVEDDAQLIANGYKAGKYEANLNSVFAADTIKRNGDGSVKKVIKNAAKKAVSKVTINAKTGVISLGAGAVTTLDGSSISINKIYKKGKSVEKVNVGTIDITVFDAKDPAKQAEYAVSSIDLAGLYGESYATIETSSKQVVKVIATTHPYANNVTFVATAQEINTADFADCKSAKDVAKVLKKAPYKTAVATADANGNVKAKKAGTAYVYAYTYNTNGFVKSNAFAVTATKSTTKFKVVKDSKFKYNNSDKSAFVVKQSKNDTKNKIVTTKKVPYSVTGTAKDATDFVAMRVLNSEGKVVLGALTKVQKTKSGKTTDVPNKYQVTLKAGKEYKAANNLTIVGQAPNGMMKGAKLTFAAK